MHDAIASGVGFLAKPEPGMGFDGKANHHVYIDEPLVVLDLRRLFEQSQATSRKGWIASAFSGARNSSSRGFVFEEVVLFILVEIFGGKAARLDEAFMCDDLLGSRKVKLVSLIRSVDGNLRTCDVSWTAGSSDRFGFKAKSPEDVLDFLDNPGGKAFLFPDDYMGPDLICFFQDVETDKLIIVVIQAKVGKKLNTGKWLSALESIDPNKYYTFRVSVEHPILDLNLPFTVT